MRKAIIRDGVVENVILIEEGSNWKAPEGTTLVDAGPNAEPGGNYAKGKFTRAPIVERKPEDMTLEERVRLLEAKAKI